MKNHEFVLYNREVDFKRLSFIYKSIKSNFPNDISVLDVGCGNGNISIYLGSKGLKVTGIDLSADAIRHAQANNSFKHVDFHVKDAEKLIYESKQYDVIICSEVLEHLHEPERLLKEIYTLLKDRGKLIITVPNGVGPREITITRPAQWLQGKGDFAWNVILKIKHLLGFRGQTNQSAADDLKHIQFFTRKDLIVLAKKTSFEIVSFKHADFIADVFPFSLFAKRIRALQRFDNVVADYIPHFMTSGFNTIWQKR